MSVAGEVTSPARLREILEQARTIAVLGASIHRARAGFYVPDYLYGVGYRIIPVNPQHRDDHLWAEDFRLRLQDIDEPVDIVDVFRHPGFLPATLPDFLAMRPAPKVIWFQRGIRQDQVAAAIVAAGIEVVQDRCTLADHHHFGVGRIARS